MVTLQAVGISTSLYVGDTAVPVCEEDDDNEEDELDEGILIENITVDSTPCSGKPLLFIYDCETTGGSFYQDHIVEVGSMVISPDGVSIHNDKFSSLCHTSRHIARKGLFFVLPILLYSSFTIVSEKCGITARDLYNQPNFTTVFRKFIEWIQVCLQQVQQEEEYYPGKLPCIHFTFPTLSLVLLSHNGFAFDFPFIVAEMKRRKLDDEFNIPNLSFADTLYDARRVG